MFHNCDVNCKNDILINIGNISKPSTEAITKMIKYFPFDMFQTYTEIHYFDS